MLFWVRKEVYIGDFKGYTKCINILLDHKIKYDYKLINRKLTQFPLERNGVGRACDTNKSNIYYLYVHKKDYDNASFLLHH